MPKTSKTTDSAAQENGKRALRDIAIAVLAGLIINAIMKPGR